MTGTAEEPAIPALVERIADSFEPFAAVALDGFLINFRAAQPVPPEMLLRGLAVALARQMSARTQHPELPAVTLRVREQVARDFEAVLRKHAPALASTVAGPKLALDKDKLSS